MGQAKRGPQDLPQIQGNPPAWILDFVNVWENVALVLPRWQESYRKLRDRHRRL